MDSHKGIETETAAWAWLERRFGESVKDPVDRAYDASEMVDAFHAGAAQAMAARSGETSGSTEGNSAVRKDAPKGGHDDD